MAIETGVFPLFEVVNGRYILTFKDLELRPVEEYLKPQGRFRHLSPEMIKQFQDQVTKNYKKLLKKTGQ